MSEVDEKFSSLLAACETEWDLDSDEALLATLAALQEQFMARLSGVKSDVDTLCNDVNVASCNLQNALNHFSLLSQTQFVENRCGVPDDASEDSSDEEKDELDHDARVAKLYADAIELSAIALEKRSIPLFNSDDEESDEEKDEEDEEDEDGEKADRDEGSDDGIAKNEAPARSQYRNRPLVAVIGTPEFLSDPYCGLHREPVAVDEETETSSSDSEAEPVLLMMKKRDDEASQAAFAVAAAPNATAPPPPQSGPAPAAAPPAAAFAAVPQPSTAVSSFQQARALDSSDDEAQPLGDIKDRVTRMYRQYNPEKLDEVPNILAKFAGRERDLMAALVKKYGPEPSGKSGAPPPPAPKAPPAKKASVGFGNDDSDDDAPAPKKAVAPMPKFAKTKAAFGSDNDSGDDAPKAAPKKAPPAPAPKKAAVASSDDSGDDAPKAAPKKAPPPPPKKTVAAVSSGDEAEVRPSGKKAPPAPPKRVVGKKTAVFSSDDSDDDKAGIVPKPKPKPKQNVYSSGSD